MIADLRHDCRWPHECYLSMTPSSALSKAKHYKCNIRDLAVAREYLAVNKRPELRKRFNVLWSPAGKGLASWLLFVMFNNVLSFSNVVFWVRCGT